MLQSKRGMMIGIVIIDRTQFRPAKSPAYSQQLRTPPGRVLTADGVFDNSPNNRYNPNPGTEVRWGDQSWEEMMAGFFVVAVPISTDPRTVFAPK